MAHCFKEELYWFRIEWGTCWSVCFRGATLKSVYTWRSTHNNNLRSAPRDGGGCSCCLPSSHVVHTHSGGSTGGPSKAHSSMCPIQCETNKVVLWCNVPWITFHIPKSLGEIKTFGTLYPSGPPNIWFPGTPWLYLLSQTLARHSRPSRLWSSASVPHPASATPQDDSPFPKLHFFHSFD